METTKKGEEAENLRSYFASLHIKQHSASQSTPPIESSIFVTHTTHYTHRKIAAFVPDATDLVQPRKPLSNRQIGRNFSVGWQSSRLYFGQDISYLELCPNCSNTTNTLHSLGQITSPDHSVQSRDSARYATDATAAMQLKQQHNSDRPSS